MNSAQTKLTAPRRQLLDLLVMYGGSLKATQLTIPDRRLASRMQDDGLVIWKAGAGANRHSLAHQVCNITDIGRLILIASRE